jgi:hypothetical protein
VATALGAAHAAGIIHCDRYFAKPPQVLRRETRLGGASWKAVERRALIRMQIRIQI